MTTGTKAVESSREATGISEVEATRLVGLAREAIEKAYAPYSNYRVGAAILTAKGNTYSGVNVENGSYGLTICAERVAIANAVAHEGNQMSLRAVAVRISADLPCSPCGACRQTIIEFGPAAAVLFVSETGPIAATIRSLLPHAYVKEPSA